MVPMIQKILWVKMTRWIRKFWLLRKSATVAEASEIIKSQEEAYANRRAEEESRWEEQEKKRLESEEQSTKRLEALASTVLDAAEVANRSASAVTNSHRSLTMGAKSLISAASNGNVKSTIVISHALLY